MSSSTHLLSSKLSGDRGRLADVLEMSGVIRLHDDGWDQYGQMECEDEVPLLVERMPMINKLEIWPYLLSATRDENSLLPHLITIIAHYLCK
jgi:hypothetical protein